MKSLIKIFSIITICLISVCCVKDKKKIVINDFTKDQSITLKPYKFYPYSMMNIKIRGFVDDTILIKLKTKDAQPILKLKGEIDEIWKTDYYGEGPRILIFEPYKATKGELEIEFNL